MKSGRRRGFTALAELLPAEEVVAILNDHFDLLVDLISQHRGFVVDFLGDAVFAVFGAPQPDPTHAEQAVACAIEMKRARAARNEETRARGWPPLEMRIGISTGPAVVGNMGALRRIKYGVVGEHRQCDGPHRDLHGGRSSADRGLHPSGAGTPARGGRPDGGGGQGVGRGHSHLGGPHPPRGEKMLVLPSPVRDLAELPAPLDASVRVFHGKQLDHQGHPARLHRLGAGGVELESVAPLSVFGSLQMLLPLGAHGEPEALDGKVVALSLRDGVPTVLVRFTGIGWDMHERLEALARGERGRPAENRAPAPGDRRGGGSRRLNSARERFGGASPTKRSLDPLGLFARLRGLALLLGRAHQPSQDQQTTNHGENLQKAVHVRVGSSSRLCGRRCQGVSELRRRS
jgi:Adenylate and Guanylate cyclase catalytic domain